MAPLALAVRPGNQSPQQSPSPRSGDKLALVAQPSRAELAVRRSSPQRRWLVPRDGIQGNLRMEQQMSVSALPKTARKLRFSLEQIEREHLVMLGISGEATNRVEAGAASCPEAAKRDLKQVTSMLVRCSRAVDENKCLLGAIEVATNDSSGAGAADALRFEQARRTGPALSMRSPRCAVEARERTAKMAVSLCHTAVARLSANETLIVDCQKLGPCVLGLDDPTRTTEPKLADMYPCLVPEQALMLVDKHNSPVQLALEQMAHPIEDRVGAQPLQRIPALKQIPAPSKPSTATSSPACSLTITSKGIRGSPSVSKSTITPRGSPSVEYQKPMGISRLVRVDACSFNGNVAMVAGA